MVKISLIYSVLLFTITSTTILISQEIDHVVSCLREGTVDHCRKQITLSDQDLNHLIYWKSLSLERIEEYVGDSLNNRLAHDQSDLFILIEFKRKIKLKTENHSEITLELLKVVRNPSFEKISDIYKCEYLKLLIELLSNSEADSEIQDTYISLHHKFSYDDLEKQWNIFFSLRHAAIKNYKNRYKLYSDITHWERLIKVCKEKRYYYLLSNVYSVYGSYLSLKPAFEDAAVDYYRKAYETAKKIDTILFKKIYFRSLANITQLDMKNKKYSSAIKILLELETEMKHYDNPRNLSLLHKWLSSCYNQLGNNDKAYKHLLISSQKKEQANKIRVLNQVRDINEKYKTDILKLDNIQKAKQISNQRYITTLFISLFIISIALLYYLRKSLIQKTSLLQNKIKINEIRNEFNTLQALEKERTRIAGEMHDDIGGGLTSIKYLSQSALRNSEDNEQKRTIEKIVYNTKELVNNMSDIIWAMNSGFDTIENLVAYIRRYTFEYLEDYNINVHFDTKVSDLQQKCTGEQRRNIFLVIKEALHNVIKHAQAEEVSIYIESDENLFVKIIDNGIGLSTTQKNVLGNGLKNMNSRIEDIGGNINFSNESGLNIEITVPLTNKSYN